MRSRLLLGLCVSVSLCLGVRGQQTMPNLILFNGKIFTSDVVHPFVQALAIRGERILAIGDSATIKALAGPKSRQIDLGGRTVIPGINDAHNHIQIFPANLDELDFENLNPTWEEAKAVIVAAASKEPKGSILRGQVGPAIYFNREVNRRTLDAIAPANAVILVTLTGHAYFLNSAALLKLGISENTIDPVGGRFEREPDGRLTGIAREYAGMQVSRALAALTSDADAVRQLRSLMDKAAEFGITSIQDMNNAMTPERCVSLLEKIPTALRLRVIRMPMTSSAGRDTREGLNVPRHPSDLISVHGIKWMLDGTPDEGTLTAPQIWEKLLHASIRRSWSELPSTFSEKEMEAMLRESLEDHEQLMVHVTGYPATSAMLDAMQATGARKVWGEKRVRFEHGDSIFPDLIQRVKEMGVIVVQNPTHLDIASDLGQVSLDKQLPLRSLLDAGIPLALGSDGPMNPYLNIMFASLHPGRPTEAITREQAVIAYTLAAAYAEFTERDKGSIEAGKFADIAVLSKDIFTVAPEELPKTASVLTLVGGTIIYDGNVLKAK